MLTGPTPSSSSARNAQAEELTYDKGLVNAVAAVYAEVIKRFAALGAQWLQLDEPYLVLDKEDGDVSLFKSLYAKILPAREDKIKVLLNTYFGHIADVYETVNLLGFDGIGLDLNEGKDENLAAVEKYGVAENTTLFAGVVNRPQHLAQQLRRQPRPDRRASPEDRQRGGIHRQLPAARAVQHRG